MACDGCGEQLPDGSKAMAITTWRGDEPGEWEHEYGEVQ